MQRERGLCTFHHQEIVYKLMNHAAPREFDRYVALQEGDSMSQGSDTISFLSAVPQFTIADLVRTAEYYRDVLGFQIAGYWDGERVSFATDPPPVFAIVWRDQVQVFFSRGGQAVVLNRLAVGA